MTPDSDWVHFRCRKCCGLGYRSQRKGREARGLEKAARIKQQLGGSGQKQLFRKGGKPGPGRPKGSKDSISRMTKEDVASFFMECTAENIRWRKNIKQKLEHALDPNEFHNLSKLALSYSIGLPAKAAAEGKEQREPLIFTTLHGYVPWDSRVDPGRERSERMIAAKAEELKALAEAKSEVIEIEKSDSEVPETLESVNPDAFGGGGSKR